MNPFHVSRRRPLCCLTLLFMLGSLSGILAQSTTLTVEITPPNNPTMPYTIGVAGLNSKDLVFYRFSDGRDLSAMNTPSNPKAFVTRTFELAGIAVAAFVVRKGGPVELITANIGNSNCNSCAPPPPAASGVSMKTSWAPSTNMISHVTDNTTTPTCILPFTPWFFLAVTMSAPSADAYSDIKLPGGMTVVGAVVKGSYIPIPGQGNYAVSDPEVKSIDYSSNNTVKITLTSNVGVTTNATVYLIVQCATELGEQSVFQAQLYEATNRQLGSPYVFRTTTQTDPHDPNLLTPFEPATCSGSSATLPLHYRVDFQNLGAGIAQNVRIKIAVDSRIIDLSVPGSVSGSPQTPTYAAAEDGIYLYFSNINLAGLDADPQPSLELTKGWVEFTLYPKPCIPKSYTTWNTTAFVTFVGIPTATGTFSETIETNTVTQLLRVCNDPLCEGVGGGGDVEGGDTEVGDTGGGDTGGGGNPPTWIGGRSEDTQASLVSSQLFAPKCYPTFVRNALQIDVPATTDNGLLLVSITDLTGRMWRNTTYQTSAGMETKESLETTTLPSGLYLVRVSQGKDFAVFKVIKE
jgi:hypothetical protein